MSQTNYIDLIQKQLSAEITQQELSQLNDWINASVANKETADSIKMIWDNTSFEEEQYEGLVGEIDLDTEFSFLEERILEDQKEKNPQLKEVKVISMRRKVLSMVAGVAVIVGLAGAWNMFNNFSNDHFVEINTGNESKEIVLSDGSLVYLNANSSLKYPEKFDGATREVELSGEAFFDIAKDKMHPFSVNTLFEEVTVLGTSFNVRAYENESKSEIAVSTGKVKVSTNTIEKIVLPNEKAIVSHSNDQVEIETTADLNELAWHTKILHFKDTDLGVALVDIEKMYDIKVKLDNSALFNCSYTSNFENTDIETLLESIAIVFDLEVVKKDQSNYSLIGGYCP